MLVLTRKTTAGKSTIVLTHPALSGPIEIILLSVQAFDRASIGIRAPGDVVVKRLELAMAEAQRARQA